MSSGHIYYGKDEEDSDAMDEKVSLIPHMVLIIGHGITEEGERYWIMKNSYGSSWGMNGYMHIYLDILDRHRVGDLHMAICYPTF